MPSNMTTRTAMPRRRSTRATAVATLATVIAVLGGVRSLPRTVTAVAIATVLALGIDPVVAAVMRRIHVDRPLAIALVLGSLITALGIVGALVVPAAVHQGQ